MEKINLDKYCESIRKQNSEITKTGYNLKKSDYQTEKNVGLVIGAVIVGFVALIVGIVKFLTKNDELDTKRKNIRRKNYLDHRDESPNLYSRNYLSEIDEPIVDDLMNCEGEINRAYNNTETWNIPFGSFRSKSNEGEASKSYKSKNHTVINENKKQEIIRIESEIEYASEKIKLCYKLAEEMYYNKTSKDYAINELKRNGIEEDNKNFYAPLYQNICDKTKYKANHSEATWRYFLNNFFDPTNIERLYMVLVVLDYNIKHQESKGKNPIKLRKLYQEYIDVYNLFRKH